RPDQRSLGPSRRLPAAQLGRPEGLRHPGVVRQPAAGRPGLLLQPDQPRRHLHRQRPHRARRQPAHRRGDLRRLLDALLGRRPPGLITLATSSTSRAGHPLRWVAGLLLVLGALAACSEDEALPAPVATAVDPVGASALLADLVDALAAGSATGDGPWPSHLVSNAAAVGVTDFSLRFVAEDAALTPTLPDGQWAAAVDL